MNVELIYFPYGSADLSGRRTERALFSATLSNQVWDRRAETVKSKLSAVEMDLLQNFVGFFFFNRFARGNTFAASIRNSLVSVSAHFTTASYVFVKLLSKQVAHQFYLQLHFLYRSPLFMFEI